MIDKTASNKIRIVLSDFDGVLCNDNDEHDIIEKITGFNNRLMDEGIHFAIISGSEENELFEELKRNNIKVINPSINKVEDAKELLDELKLDFDEALFIGDDILDIPLLQKVKISVAPKKARREVKRIVHHQIDNGSLDKVSEEVFNILS